MRARWGYKIVPTVIVSIVIASLIYGRYTDLPARYRLENESIQIGSDGQVAGNVAIRRSPPSAFRPATLPRNLDHLLEPDIALSGLQTDGRLSQGVRHQAELSELSPRPRRISAALRDKWQFSSPSAAESSGDSNLQQQLPRSATAPASEFSRQAQSPAILTLPNRTLTAVKPEPADAGTIIAERPPVVNLHRPQPDSVEMEFSNGQVRAVRLAQNNQIPPEPAPNQELLDQNVETGTAGPVAALAETQVAPDAVERGTLPLVADEPGAPQASQPAEPQRPESQANYDHQDTGNSPQAETAESTVERSLDEDQTSEHIQPASELSGDTIQLDLDPEAFWWKRDLGSPLADTTKAERISLDELIMSALQNSPRILAISQEPLVEELEVVKSESRFDPELFLRTKYDDRTDPVGNALTTGGPGFLRDHIWSGDSGFRKKLMSGGAIDVKQTLGFQNSNSRYFLPQDQGTATLSLNYSQPLLKGAGRMYNESKILLAQTFSEAAWQKYYSELQDELLRVAEAYWRLYYFRSVLRQKRHSLQRGQEILVKLNARSELDSLPSQIARARAAVESRRAELANAFRDVKNSETEIRKLIAQPNRAGTDDVEMIPSDAPRYDHVDYHIEQVVETALDFRPEIKHSLDRAKAAAIEFDVSRNELLPELSMLFGTYVAGLEGNSNIGRAWTEQFSNTTPGYYAGLEYKIPRGNRYAKSEYEQRRLRLAKIRYEVDVVVQDVIADSQIALRRVNSAYRTLRSSVSAIAAANADLRYNQSRWEAFAFVEGDFVERVNPTTLLDQLLEAQQRLTNEEIRFAQAELEFKNSQFYLKRAMGTLLQTVPVQSSETSISP